MSVKLINLELSEYVSILLFFFFQFENLFLSLVSFSWKENTLITTLSTNECQEL